jgi:hypothetical protein
MNNLSLQLEKLLDLHGIENMINSLADVIALKTVQVQLSSERWDCDGLSEFADIDRESANTYERLCAGLSEFANTADYSGIK